jgi:hypothetical protein
VKAHPYTDWALNELSLGLRRCRDCLARILESDQEGVSLRVDLDPAVARKCLAQHAAVRSQGFHVAGAELMQQARRALDVGEEKGDGAGWKLVIHEP